MLREPPMGPAYRIQSSRLLLRCWQPADAPLLKAAIDSSIDHLKPWMPWAAGEPTDVCAKVQLLRRFRGEFDLDRNYVYGIFTPDEAEVLGGCGLHARAGKGALEIGYWIAASHAGRGLATEAAAALTRIAFDVHQVERAEIHCDPRNTRSAAVPRKLGYLHEATLRGRARTAEGKPRDSMVWTLFRDTYAHSPAAGTALTAFDAAGDRIL